jgi:hypothetical protein
MTIFFWSGLGDRAITKSFNPELSRNGMNSPLLFRVAQPLIAIGLAALAGCSHSETMIGTSGPLTAFRVQAFLGWEIEIKNHSDAKYPALYAINGWTSLRHVPAHGTVKAGYVLGREIPTFYFAEPPLRGSQRRISINLTVKKSSVTTVRDFFDFKP